MDVIGQAVSGLLGSLIFGIFQVILKVFDVLFAPFISIITAMFPDFSTLLSQILYFLNTYIFTGTKFVMSLLSNLLGIPKSLFVVLTTYLLFLVGAKIVISAYNSTLNIYRKLKP